MSDQVAAPVTKTAVAKEKATAAANFLMKKKTIFGQGVTLPIFLFMIIFLLVCVILYYTYRGAQCKDTFQAYRQQGGMINSMEAQATPLDHPSFSWGN